MFSKNSKSFTLIELLVVISIIGLISSIVLVSMKGFGEDARLAKSKKFSSSIQHVLGADAVGIWRFEAISAGTTPDESGYGNDGTVNGATLVGSEIYPSTNALSFDGADNVSIPITNMSNNYGTFEEWIKPVGWNGGDSSYHGSFQTRVPGSWGNNIGQMIVLDQWGSNTFYFRIVPDSGCCPTDVTFSTSGVFKDGEWTYIAISWNKSDNTIKVYIDGKLKAERVNWTHATTTALEATGYIGVGHDRYANSVIDEVRIYDTALTTAEILKHYTEGAARHNIALK